MVPAGHKVLLHVQCCSYRLYKLASSIILQHVLHPNLAVSFVCQPSRDAFKHHRCMHAVLPQPCFVQEVLVHGHGGALHAIAWHPVSTGMFATACEAPRLSVFDAQRCSLVKACAVSGPQRAVAWSPIAVSGTSHHLATGSAGGKIAILDEATLKPLCAMKECAQAITDLKYSPSGSTLAAATAARHIDLYTVGAARYARAARCLGHSALVRHVDWSADGKVLQSACSAYEVLAWNGTSGKQVTASQRDTAWRTWTSILGFPVMGIWPSDSDGTDVNAVARDSAGTLVATADDAGLVKLFNYPCVVADAPHRAYLGHSAHVTAVRFSADGAWLASAGGSDRTVMQFRVAPAEAPAKRAAAPPPEPVWSTVDGKHFGWTDAAAVAGNAQAAGPGSVHRPLSSRVSSALPPVAEEAEDDERSGSSAASDRHNDVCEGTMAAGGAGPSHMQTWQAPGEAQIDDDAAVHLHPSMSPDMTLAQRSSFVQASAGSSSAGNAGNASEGGASDDDANETGGW